MVQLLLRWLAGRRWLANRPFPLALFYQRPSWYPSRFKRCPFCHRQVGDGTCAHRNDRPAARTLNKGSSTLTNGVVSAFVCFEVGAQLLHAGVTVLLGNYRFLVKNYSFVPLRKHVSTSVCFSSWAVSLLPSSADSIIVILFKWY